MSDYQQEMVPTGPIPGQVSMFAPGEHAKVPRCRVEELHGRLPSEDELEEFRYEMVPCHGCNSAFVWAAVESWDDAAKAAGI